MIYKIEPTLIASACFFTPPQCGANPIIYIVLLGGCTLRFLQKIPEKILYILCGILTALPLLDGNLWIIGWLSLIPILYNEYKKEKNRILHSWTRGLCFFISFNMSCYIWLFGMFPLDFAGLSWIESVFVILLAWIGISLLQGIVSSCFFVLIQWIDKRKKIIWTLWCALCYVLFEWVLTLGNFSLPWNKLAIGQTKALFNLQSISLFGPYFISFLIVLVSAMIAV